MVDKWVEYHRKLDRVKAYAYAAKDMDLDDSVLDLLDTNPRNDFLTEGFLEKYAPEKDENSLRRRISALTKFIEEELKDHDLFSG